MAQNKSIFIKISVDDKKANQGLDRTTSSVDKLSSAKKKLVDLQRQEAIELEKVNEQIRIQKDVNLAAARSDLGLATSKKAVVDQQKKFKTQSGLNNAILLETGRLASDASYGFTAIANNLSQLVSLFGSFVATTGNVNTALGQLGKSIMGTGGVLLAVQLLIGALQSKKVLEFVESLNGVSAAMRALRKSTEEATNSYGQQVSKLEILTKLLQDERMNQSQRSMILKELEEDNKNLNIQLDEQNRLTDESVVAVNARIDALKIQAETEALLQAIGEERTKQLQLETKDLSETISTYDFLISQLTSFGDSTKAAMNAVERGEKSRRKELGKSQEIIDKLYERLSQVINFDTDEKEGNKKRERRFKEFREGLFNIQNIIDKYNKEADKINVRTLDERLDLEEEFAKRDADTKLKNFTESQAKRLEEYKERVKGAKNANQLIANAELEFQSSIEDAKVKHANALLSIEEGFVSKRILLKDAEAQAIGKIERNIENVEINRLRESIGANELFFQKKTEQVTKDKENVDAQIQNAETLKLSDLEVAQLRKESFMLQNQLIDLNLNKEITAIDEKKRVNLEYVSFVGGISSILSNLAGENEALQKAALVIEKGAAIADIVISNTASNLKLRAQATAAAPPPANLPFIAAAEAQILRNNIGAGIGIGNILATTISSFKSPSQDVSSASSSTAAQVTATAPQFNVVGTGATNQLAQAVGQQQQQPLKAFVVGSEVTNQQQLDRKILNTAGI